MIVCVGTPGHPEDGTLLIEDADNTSGNYSEGKAVVYKCSTVGYGYVAQICQQNGSFSAPDRACTGA